MLRHPPFNAPYTCIHRRLPPTYLPGILQEKAGGYICGVDHLTHAVAMMKFFKRFNDLAIEGAQAKYYDILTREHRMSEMRAQATEVSAYLKDGDAVLEIAPGAGYLSIELSKLGKYKITGMDLSKDLVEICTRNAKEAHADIDFRQGSILRHALWCRYLQLYCLRTRIQKLQRTP